MVRLLSGRAETSAVRRALRLAGLKPLRVYRGRGTAYGWLHIHLAGPAPDLRPTGGEDWYTPNGQERERIRSLAAGIVEEVTGRNSDDDDIQTDLFMSQYIIKVEAVPQAVAPVEMQMPAPDAHLEQEYEDRQNGGLDDGGG